MGFLSPISFTFSWIVLFVSKDRIISCNTPERYSDVVIIVGLDQMSKENSLFIYV